MRRTENNSRAHWIRLADAYQHLGRASYENWRNCHVAEVLTEQYELFNLQSFLQSTNHQNAVQQFFPMKLVNIRQHRVDFIDTEVKEHVRIKDLLLKKVIGAGVMAIECKDSKGNQNKTSVAVLSKIIIYPEFIMHQYLCHINNGYYKNCSSNP